MLLGNRPLWGVLAAGLILVAVGLATAAPRPTSAEDYTAAVGVVWVGRDEVELSLGFTYPTPSSGTSPTSGPSCTRGRLYRDQALIRTFGAGSSTYTDSGLTSGKAVTYRAEVVCDNKVVAQSTDTATPGNVGGTLRHDYHMSGSTWSIGRPIKVYAGRLTIDGGAVVEPSPTFEQGTDSGHIILDGGGVDVRSATLRRLYVQIPRIGSSDIAGSRLAIRESTLEDTFIGDYQMEPVLTDFRGNSGYCTKGPSGSSMANFRVSSVRTAIPTAYADNVLPGCSLYVVAREPGVGVDFRNNSLSAFTAQAPPAWRRPAGARSPS